MPLTLIHGPPNSGRAGIVRRRFTDELPSSPVLVLPTLDDVFAFERELCREEGALLGGAVLTFDGLFEQVAGAAGAVTPPRIRGAQRERLLSVATVRVKPRILSRSASRPGFAKAATGLVAELQAAMLDPSSVEAAASELEDSAYLGELAAIYRAYSDLRDSQGLGDRHLLAAAAIAALKANADTWKGRPVFLYGFDDLTGEQLELVTVLSQAAPVTVALTYEDRPALAARATLLQQLREIGPAIEEETEPDPANTESPLLFAIERGFGNRGAETAASDGSLVMLHCAGERAEAEAIGAEIARLLAGGEEPGGIAIAVRDPAGRGRLFREVLEPFGIPVALEADVPVSGTATGAALLALLRAAFTTRSAADVLAHLRGPRRGRPGDVDWLERTILRQRLRSADEAAEAWAGISGRELGDLARLRSAGDDPGTLLGIVAGIARDIAEWPLAREQTQGVVPDAAGAEELRAAAAIAVALERLGELSGLEPGPGELIESIRGLTMPLWRGPAEGRVRVASPYRLRAGRFRHLFVASLQDGEFPRRGGGSPFLSDEQRARLGLPARAETEAEERYLFYACLSLPTTGLWLSCRLSDESGGSEQPSPLLGEVRRLLDPPPPEDPGRPDPLEAELVRARGLDEVTFAPGAAPSEVELARSLALRPAAERGTILPDLEIGAEAGQRIGSRLAAASERVRRTRAPGPLRVPEVISGLGARGQYGATTLEVFAVCSYRWFVGEELRPEPLGPAPEPIAQGGLMHSVLEALYRERPGGDPIPRPGSLALWSARGLELVSEKALEQGLSGGGVVERAMRRRVGRLLEAFLRREAARDPVRLEPEIELLEATFGDDDASQKPALELGEWSLHGKIDRVDLSPSGTGLIHDYKVARKVTPCAKFEREGKLQLPLYLIALRELWGIEPIGGLYQPLRPTGDPRPRGLVLENATEELTGFDLVGNDSLAGADFAGMLEADLGDRDSGRAEDAGRRDRPRPDRGRVPPLLRIRPDLPPRAGGRRRDHRRGGRDRGADVSRVPTPEQTAAVQTRAPEVLLEAGAGTGKTGVLVDRYCELVELDRLGPEEILAFTFTDRAAAQLRDRIRAELDRRMREAGDGETGERLGALLDEFGGAWITTIHGFCRRLLASHPIAAGIDPSFRVLESAESQRAAQGAFDAALDEFLAGGDEARETTVAAYGIDGLRRAVIGAHEELRSSGEAEPQLPPAPESDLPGALATLEAGAVAAIAEPGCKGPQRIKMEAARDLAAARAERIPAIDDLLGLSFTSKNGLRSDYLKALKNATAVVGEHEGGRQSYDHLSALVRAFGARFAGSKAERSGLDFEDLQLLAVRLLRQSPAVRDSYAERFKHLLVDEFQDTNALQLELIETLRGPHGSVFFVGDEFQSIYGFRHADVEVFRRQRELLQSLPADSVLPLSGNFRSRPEVIAMANRIGELMLPGFRPLTVGASEQAEGGLPGGGHAVELLLTEEKGWNDLDLKLAVDDSTSPKFIAEARFLAERLRQLADAGVPRREMVVLLRAFTRVDAYEEALERAGLRPYVVGGRGYWSGQQVGDVLCLLRVIANPLDDEALLGALASPAFGASPDALWLLRRASGRGRHLWPALLRAVGRGEPAVLEPQWLEHIPPEDRGALAELQEMVAELRQAGTRLPLEQMVERAVTLSGYDLAVLMRSPGRMRMANVRKLMRMAREFESAEGRDLRGFLGFAEFRAGLDDEPVAATEAEDHDGVRVMTIHSAKGLEFEVVAVPSLDRGLLSGGFPPPLRIGPAGEGRRKVGMRLTRLGGRSLGLFDLAELTERDQQLSSEEERRLFYVAATRAQTRLILSGVRAEKPATEPAPGTPVLERLLAAPGFADGVADGDLVTLPAPPPRTGLAASFAEAEVLVRVNAPSAERAAELVASSSAPDPAPPEGAGSPPLLTAKAPPTPLRPLSYSALREHDRCGFRFYAERVLGMQPPPDRGTGGAASRSERFGFGSTVHSLLEYSARRRWIDPPADLVRRTLEAEGLEATAELIGAATARVRGWTASALCAELGARGTRVRPELPLLLELGGAVVRGSIDLMAEPAKGPPTVIDYKTDHLGGATPTERARNYETQRMLYALAASEATGADTVRVAYVFLEQPSDPVVTELGPEDLGEARVALGQRVAEIAAGSFGVTEKPDWPLCHDCPARRRLCSGPAPEPEPAAA